MIDIDSMWRHASVPAVLELLRGRNGEAKALKIARLELRKARRARSRKRFDFWNAVSAQLETRFSGQEMPGPRVREERVPGVEGSLPAVTTDGNGRKRERGRREQISR